MITIANLRKAGHKVRVHHERPKCWSLPPGLDFTWLDDYSLIKFHINNLGGSTTVTIDTLCGSHYEGKAVCSAEDNYNKKVGVQIALGRCGILENIHLMDQILYKVHE